MRTAFVILNYKNLKDTISCIESIRSLTLGDYCIVVVDNGSLDGSYEKLVENYGEFPEIVILKSEENLGFSKGNNLGYRYVRENYPADFVIVTNNDVLFPQKDMIDRIAEIYDETSFFVLGPDILVRETKEHQSPMMLEPPTVDKMSEELEMYRFYLSHPKKWARRWKIQVLKNQLCQRSKTIRIAYEKLKKTRQIDRSKSYVDCCVQGACIIVSGRFLQAEEKIFTPEPFLYCEEILLYLKCLKNRYKIVYDPRILIWHEDSSTIKKISGDPVRRAKFTLPHHVAARELVLEVLNKQ